MRLPIANIKKETRKLIREKRNEKQGMISEMKDVYDPVIINPIKKTIDENQDELIEQLQDEQKDMKLALTQGKSLEFDVGALFDEFDRETIKKYNLKEPYSFFSSSKEELLETRNRLNDLTSQIGQEKTKITKKTKADKKHKRERDEEDKRKYDYYEKETKTLKEYRKLLDNILLYKGGIKGSGIRRYVQKPRHAYKINDNKYGNLAIDVPRLLNEMKLNVYKGGKLVYENDVDKSFVDLVTKRFNGRKPYTTRALQIFNDLNMLSNIKKHKSSKKSKLKGGSVFYTSPEQLLSRLELLTGSLKAGNTNFKLKNEISQILEHLLKISVINRKQYDRFVEKFLIH